MIVRNGPPPDRFRNDLGNVRALFLLFIRDSKKMPPPWTRKTDICSLEILVIFRFGDYLFVVLVEGKLQQPSTMKKASWAFPLAVSK